jgi:hypothetical protein
MEARLKSLCMYHADLYSDPRFNNMGTKLIQDAKSIRKGSRPSKLQKILLVFHLIRFGWFLTPVLWTCAELLFLLTTVFDPRLLFVHVVQKNAKSVCYEQTQNRGMASCSKYLSNILFDRLGEFDLLSTKHECGDAVVLDSNGSHLQHYEAERTTKFFKAMLPHKVVKVTNAPAAFSCNGCYTQISPTLYAQNVAYPSPLSEFEPEPRIIESTNGRWYFKHLLAQGVDCWLMQQVEGSENPDSDGQQQFLAWRGFDGISEHDIVDICIKEHQGSDPVHAFDFGIGGGYKHIEKALPRPVLDAQRIHSDGDPGYDPLQFNSDGTINLAQPIIFSDDDLIASETRALGDETSHLPAPATSDFVFSAFSAAETSAKPSFKTPLSSVFDGPLGALFSLMFGTGLGFFDCNIQIPIGACLLFSFLFPHRGALYDYLNRRFHLYILNGDFRRIPAANVEQRFRILACSKQRHHAHGMVDFYDLSLLHNLSTYELKSGCVHPFSLERFRIVFKDGWVYSGDINLAKQPNGYGHKILSDDTEITGFFKNGEFVRCCDEHDDAVAATRHVNRLFMLLEFLKDGPDAVLVVGSVIDVLEEFEKACNALSGIPNVGLHVSATVILNISNQVQRLPGVRLSTFKVSANVFCQRLMDKLAPIEHVDYADMLNSAHTDNYADMLDSAHTDHDKNKQQMRMTPDSGSALAAQDGFDSQSADISIDDVQQNVASLVQALTDYCIDPPVVNTTESGCTISCIWKPSELSYGIDVDFSCKIEKRGGSDVITAVEFSTSSKVPDHRDFLTNLNERVLLPFYIMSHDHARLFIKRTIWLDMDESLAEPPACPMKVLQKMSASGVSFAIASSDGASEFSDPRYSRFIEWLDVPPTFPRGQQPSLPSCAMNPFLLFDIKVIESLMQRNLKSCNSLSSRL